jgi:hypothetical protein
MSDGGKGSKPRPLAVDMETYSNNWDQIFKKPDASKIDQKVVDTDLEEYKKQARELWNDSCTSVRENEL